jgi:transposase
MDDTNSLPNDPTECHALLLAAFQRAKQLEQRAAEAERRAAESEQKVAELGRVLDEPAKLEAHIHVRPKYACRRCKDGVCAAPLPPRPIPGGIAGPGLITEVYVGKFGDHLPLYRLEDILSRYGVYLSRSTLCDWMKGVARLLRPLYELQRERVLQSSVMWTDDTHVTVIGGAKGSFQGYFWTYIGDDQHPYSVYDFTNSRTRDGPTRFLESYSGYLHADAYTGYVLRPGLAETASLGLFGM